MPFESSPFLTRLGCQGALRWKGEPDFHRKVVHKKCSLKICFRNFLGNKRKDGLQPAYKVTCLIVYPLGAGRNIFRPYVHIPFQGDDECSWKPSEGRAHLQVASFDIRHESAISTVSSIFLLALRTGNAPFMALLLYYRLARRKTFTVDFETHAMP